MRGSIHTLRTACPPVVHNPHSPSTRCGYPRRRAAPTVRVVSQTPTYDQLRGERINAEIPPSEDNPPGADQPGKHRPADDAPHAPAPGHLPEPASDLTPAWSWFDPINAGSLGKHHLWGDVPKSAESLGQPPSPPACQPAPPTLTAPQAALPPVAHARLAPPHGARSCPAPAADDNHPQDAVVGGHGVRPGPGCQPQSVHRAETRYPMPRAVH